MPMRRNRVAPTSWSSKSRPAAKMRAASWVGWPSARARVRILKSALLSFSVTVEPASALAFSRADTFSVSSQSVCSSGRNSLMSRSKVVSAEMLLVSRSRIDGARVDAARQTPEPGAFLAVAADQIVLVGALQIGDQPIAVGGKLGGAHLADAVDEADRLWRQKRRGLCFCRARRSRAACPCRRRSWREICWPTVQSIP